MTLRRASRFWGVKKGIVGPPTAPTLSTFGTVLSTTATKYTSAVLGADGKIYCSPYENVATQILKIDPDTDTISFVGSTYSGASKWSGGSLAPNGNIYFAPAIQGKILKLDPTTGTTSLIGTDYGIAAPKWDGAVLANDGCIYFCPRNASQVLKLDPTTDTTSLIGSSYSGVDKYFSGVLAENGMIYWVPANGQNQVLKLDPSTGSTSLIGSTYTGSYKWIGAVLHLNGKIYGINYSSTRILEIDPATDTTALVGPTVSTNYFGGGLAPNGLIYCTPREATSILAFRPSDYTAYNYGSLGGGGKWASGVLADNGAIYCPPFNNTNVLKISGIGVAASGMVTLPSPISGLSVSAYNKYQNKM